MNLRLSPRCSLVKGTFTYKYMANDLISKVPYKYELNSQLLQCLTQLVLIIITSENLFVCPLTTRVA